MIESKRNVNVNLMKGIAAVLVLIGHSIQYSPVDENNK